MTSKKITYSMICKMHPEYYFDSRGIPSDYSASVADFIKEWRNNAQIKEHILYFICREEFMTEKDLRSLAVWHATQVKHLIPKSNLRILAALHIATKETETGYPGLDRKKYRFSCLRAGKMYAKDSSENAACAVVYALFADSADFAATSAAWAAGYAILRDTVKEDKGTPERAESWAKAIEAVRDTQMDKLLTFFEGVE